MHTREELLELVIESGLQRLNALYGRGDVQSFIMDVHTGTGKVTIRVPMTQHTGHEYTRRFHYNNDTLYYAGHQQKIKVD